MREDILRVLRALPAGRTVSYGEVARRAGWPGRARLVARILSESSAADALPWHRVLRADGRLAFAPGSADFKRQQRLLAAEGVEVDGAGRVHGLNAKPEADLDRLLWS